VDKVKECGLTVCTDQPAPYFAQAELTLICRKLYAQDFDPACFVDESLDGKNYPGKDYHRMYIGEIVAVLKK
jgi:flavin reductase (DIM6/NTAB) family NADH-FMN oxidoreductase RutF